MRRKINNKLKEYLLKNAENYSLDKLALKVNKKFDEHYDKDSLRKYLWRNRIPYKYECKNRSNNGAYKRVSIGTEYIKPDGMVLVKIDKNKWEYKQRLIYEKYYNVKLSENDFVIFLDDDRTNFDINNLRVISKKEASYIASYKTNYGICKTDKDTTETLILMAKLLIKVKEKK